MTESFDLIFGLLTTPPGNLAYYLALSFTVIAALQASINNFRRSHFPQGSRMVAGLSLLFIFQLAQFAVAGMAWLGLLETEVWLPPVDRLIVLLSILVVVWLWLLPEPSRLGDLAFGILFFLAVSFFVLSLLWWTNQAPQIYFNASWPDWGAALLGMIALGLGLLGLLIRRPVGWGIGFTMLLLLFAGQSFHLLFLQPESDYSGPVRLFQLMSFPWLMTLPQRFPLLAGGTRPAAQAKATERRRYAADPQTVQELVSLLDAPSDQNLCLQTTRLVSQLMLADICLLATLDSEGNNLTVACGYNLIEERPIDGYSIEVRFAPMLSNALRRNKPLRLPSSSTSADLHALASGLHTSRVGHLLAVPIAFSSQSIPIGLVLLSPFSNRGWDSEEQSVLQIYARYLAHVLQRSMSPAAGERNWAALLPPSEESQEPAEVSPQAYAELQANLRFALEQLADLRLELTQAGVNQPAANQPPPESAVLETLLQSPGSAGETEISPSAGNKAIANLVQELNQPMASILGYTELLLGESIGILGAMQKKFLERIHASIERMGGLMDDLLQLTSMSEDEFAIRPQQLDLLPVILAAVEEVKDDLDTRQIDLQVDLPDQLPLLNVDQASIQRVISDLLRAAGKESPVSGRVALKARVEVSDQEPGFVMLQVSDSGEGITSQDLPHVFSRVYAQEHARSNGLDLVALKAIIEAHGGRMWVDSTLGEGSTYSALLPIPVG